MLYDWSMDSNYSTSLGSRIVVCAGAGGANTTPYFLAAHFAKRNTKFGGGGKRGRAKIPPPQPPSFLPARAFSFGSAARSAAMGQFLSKKVRAKCIITAPKLTCSEMTAPRGEYAALRRAKSAIVFAVKSQSSPQ